MAAVRVSLFLLTARKDLYELTGSGGEKVRPGADGNQSRRLAPTCAHRHRSPVLAAPIPGGPVLLYPGANKTGASAGSASLL